MQAQRERHEAFDHTQRQQLERLQYQGARAERQLNQGEPANRLGAAELETRGETALRELTVTPEAYETAQHAVSSQPMFSPDRQAACTAIGQQRPKVWAQDVLSQAQKKARLRGLLDQVVLPRRQRDPVHTRSVWQGGETTTVDLPLHVGSWRQRRHSAA